MDEQGPDGRKKRNQRNIAIALAIGVFVAIVYVVTILKLGASLAQ